VSATSGLAYCSEPGAGATFKIYFPRVQALAEPVDGTIATSIEVPRGSETILLVEDEREVRALARDILLAHGYSVLDGAGALRIAERYQGDLILTDVVMPGLSGPELANRLTAVRPGMVVLYMSGYTDAAVVHHGVLDPRAAFLQKPMAPDALARKVRDLLDRRRRTAANST